jgi:predicted acylesterase/phospholipase RssA
MTISRPAAIALIVAGFLMSACASRPSSDLLAVTAKPWGAANASTFVQSPGTKKTASRDVLILSGGGINGAFGAGVVVGWTKTGKRPDFDIVSGVSAGALIGVLAFAGPDYDKALERSFTNVSKRDLIRPRVPDGLFKDSLADNAPLRKRIERVVTPDLLDRIAKKHESGKRLYVTTTNLDAGEKVIWDMGAIAASERPNRLRRFQDILVASAAIPGFYRPVYLTVSSNGKTARQMHVDGGLKFSVPVSDEVFPDAKAKSRIRFIVNGYLEKPQETKPVKPSLAGIGSRSINEMMWSQFDAEVEVLRSTSQTRKDNLGIWSIPPTYPDAPTLTSFDTSKMNELFALGFQMGSQQ